MTYHNKEKQEVLQELNVQEATGLSSSEVKKRREQYGENRLRAKKSKSNWERFAEQFKDVMILILLAAAAISFAFRPGLSAPPEELAARLLYQISQQELTLKKLMKCSAPALQTIL